MKNESASGLLTLELEGEGKDNYYFESPVVTTKEEDNEDPELREFEMDYV